LRSLPHAFYRYAACPHLPYLHPTRALTTRRLDRTRVASITCGVSRPSPTIRSTFHPPRPPLRHVCLSPPSTARRRVACHVVLAGGAALALWCGGAAFPFYRRLLHSLRFALADRSFLSRYWDMAGRRWAGHPGMVVGRGWCYLALSPAYLPTTTSRRDYRRRGQTTSSHPFGASGGAQSAALHTTFAAAHDACDAPPLCTYTARFPPATLPPITFNSFRLLNCYTTGTYANDVRGFEQDGFEPSAAFPILFAASSTLLQHSTSPDALAALLDPCAIFYRATTVKTRL